jgi:hypothetical protein
MTKATVENHSGLCRLHSKYFYPQREEPQEVHIKQPS